MVPLGSANNPAETPPPETLDSDTRSQARVLGIRTRPPYLGHSSQILEGMGTLSGFSIRDGPGLASAMRSVERSAACGGHCHGLLVLGSRGVPTSPPSAG